MEKGGISLGKKKLKTWVQIKKDYDDAMAFSCVPDGIKKLPENHVIDMEQSVRWNMEHVQSNNNEYLKEVTRLNKIKNKLRDAVLDDVYRKIQEETGHGLSIEDARNIWDYAWKQSPSEPCLSAFSETVDILLDLIDLIQKILP